MIVELTEDSSGKTFQIHCFLHRFLYFVALFTYFIVAKADFLLETLNFFAKASHNISFLMPWCALNCIYDFADLLMLVLKILETILLPSVLSNKVLHVRIALNINQLLP